MATAEEETKNETDDNISLVHNPAKKHSSGASNPFNLPDISGMEQLIIKQPIRAAEWFCETCFCFEMEDKYEVADMENNDMFEIQEESGCCARQILRNRRCLQFELEDLTTGAVVVKFQRPFRMGCICFGSKSCIGRDYLEIKTGAGRYVGCVCADFVCCGIGYTLMDKDDQVIGVMRRNCILCGCWDQDFPVFPPDGKDEIGRVTKKWGGVTKELLTQADTFMVKFPEEFNIANRFVLIGAALLIQMRYFERGISGT